jgi:hypothetical protein
MNDSNTGGAGAVFVIVLSEVLIAHDIELVIGDVRPDATVIVARTLDEAAGRVPSDARIEIAFVAAAPAAYRASHLAALVSASGGHVVLLGQDAATGAAGDDTCTSSVLHFPFTRDHVIAHLSCASVE